MLAYTHRRPPACDRACATDPPALHDRGSNHPVCLLHRLRQPEPARVPILRPSPPQPRGSTLPPAMVKIASALCTATQSAANLFRPLFRLLRAPPRLPPAIYM